MTSKLTATVACLSLVASLGVPSLVRASPPEHEAPAAPPETATQIALIVDASAIDEEFRRQLEVITTRQLEPALKEAGYEVADGVVALAVRVRFKPIEGGQFRDHGIHFEFIKGDKVDAAIQWVLCNGCGQVRLEELLAASTPGLVDALEKSVHSPASQSDDGPEGEGSDEPRPPTVPKPKPIGPLGFAGLGVAVLGLGVTIGGGVELSRGRVYEQDETFYEFVGTDHRPIGYALIGVGAAATVAGLVMLGIDVGRRAKQRKQARAQVLIIPSLSPANAGVGVVGRF